MNNNIDEKPQSPVKRSYGFAIAFAIAILLIVISVIRSGGQRATAQGFDEWLDKPAPELAVEDLNGDAVKLSQFKGKRVILAFWATWCPPCKMEIPHFIKLADRYKDDLVIIGISNEDKETISKFAAQNGINYTLAVGSYNMAPPYSEITAIPTTFFIDGEGIIRNVVVGYHDFKELESKIKALNIPISPNI